MLVCIVTPDEVKTSAVYFFQHLFNTCNLVLCYPMPLLCPLYFVNKYTHIVQIINYILIHVYLYPAGPQLNQLDQIVQTYH